MLLEKLPIELVQQIIGHVLQDGRVEDSTALLGVSRILEAETTGVILRSLASNEQRASYWTKVLLPIRRRMASDAIMYTPDPSTKRTIATYMHAVTSTLMQYARTFDADSTGRLSHTQWLYEIASVLAPLDADCRCGKPAFMHSRCYNLSSVADTAFHIAILKRHTKLEIAMIQAGKGVGSICPYLKVSLGDITRRRRNALEWACAYGYDDSIRRMIEASEYQGHRPGTFLPTAAAVCAVLSADDQDGFLESLLEYLDEVITRPGSDSPGFWYKEKNIGWRQWYRILLIELSKCRKPGVISMLTWRYPWVDVWNESVLCPRFTKPMQIRRRVFELERPCCSLDRSWWEYWLHKHWNRCSREMCYRNLSDISS